MRIKHWQGYGCVNAVRKKSKDYDLVVLVSGNHEWGLRRDDTYDLFHWLIRKFDKSVAEKSYAEVRPQVYIQHWEYDGTEYCQYSFKYRKNF